MDPKWFPDFVRIVDEFEYTQTQKVLVRNLKQVHFDRRRLRRRADLLASARRRRFRFTKAADQFTGPRLFDRCASATSRPPRRCCLLLAQLET